VFQTTVEDWKRVQRVNLRGPFLGIKMLAPLLSRAGKGSIVNIGSGARLGGSLHHGLCDEQVGPAWPHEIRVRGAL
jgi:NAD(P)-dependent dehydrogenase (short-subunit alcohol dehydrogenase family)